jgi:chemotaxis protein MotB
MDPMARPPAEDPSGVLMYPKAERPRDLRAESPPVKGFNKPLRGRTPWMAGIAGAAVLGLGVGYVVKPSKAGALADAQTAADSAKKAAGVEKDRADGLDKQLSTLKQQKADADAQLAKAGDVDKKAADLAAAQAKIQATIDKTQGSVDTEGDEIHLKLVDKVLFATGDDQLTDRGKGVLDKVAVALKDLPDKQVWVQGHTDDQPIFIKKDPKAKPPPPLPKGAKPPPQKYVTNWELSASRALQVVHYLQDIAKIDPGRLAALAFGQYRPVSRSNKALNRRIEIVLYPKREILVKQ